MTAASERSLGDDATFAGHAKRQRADVSIGDERTLGDGLSGQETIIDDIQVVDLDARYRIEGELGQGGMGAVLLATDTRLDRKVAIKRILGEAAGNRMAVNRFLTEAKSIAALNHPNIVQIYDYGQAKDGPFLIMEFVDGGSLLDKCRDGAMPLEDAVAMACQLCDGLAKAHDVGIIHRDVKPANVLLTKDGIPKLTDFGLAKAQAGDHGQTMTGAVLGTPDFMPPEQRRDASLVDNRSDLWSLAATVYQMATGRSPKIIRFDLLPVELTHVLGKALEDDKEARYQSARELRDAIKASLRAAAVTPAVAETGEGRCPACGAQNDVSRKFCRGCGGPLVAPCLSCDTPMPMWEEICGSCGVKQTPLVEVRRSEMAAAQAKAEGLLGDFGFDKAAELATRLRDEPHARLSHLRPWAEGFLREVGKARAHQTERAAESLAEAAKHEQAFDYLSAVHSLETVPDAMRSAILPGGHEPVAEVLARLRQKQAESRRLETLVRERISTKAIDGLLPEVDKLLKLHPNRHDVQKLRQQLVDRQQKQIAARVEALQKAASLIDDHDYEGALGLLSGVATAAMTTEVMKLRQQAESLAAEVKDLVSSIRSANASGKHDGILVSIDRLLQLKPAETEFVALRHSIVSRQEAIESERRTLAVHAEGFMADYRYQEAVQALEGMSAEVETQALLHLRSRARSALAELEGLRKQIRSALAEKSLDGLLDTVTRYLRLNPNDGEATSLLRKLSAREEELAKDFEAFCTDARSLLEAGKWQAALAAVRQRTPRPNETPTWTQLLSQATTALNAEYEKALAVRKRLDEQCNSDERAGILFGGFILSWIVYVASAAALYFFPSIASLQSAWAWSGSIAVGFGACGLAVGMGFLFPFLWRVHVEIVVVAAAYGAIVMFMANPFVPKGFNLGVATWVLGVLPVMQFLFTNIDGRIQLLESLGARAHEAPAQATVAEERKPPKKQKGSSGGGGVRSCPHCGKQQAIAPGNKGLRVECLICKKSYIA